MNNENLKFLLAENNNQEKTFTFESHMAGNFINNFYSSNKISPLTKIAFIHWKNPLSEIVENSFNLLSSNFKKGQIINFGNIIPDKIPLLEMTEFLIEKNILPVIFSEDRSTVYEISEIFFRKKLRLNLTTIDSIIRSNSEDDIIDKLIGRGLNHLSCIGYQTYLTPAKLIHKFNNQLFELERLGKLRNNVELAEPIIRDNNLFNLDLSAVRHSDAPNIMTNNPNGLFAYEACQLIRYAAISEKNNAIIISGINGQHREKEVCGNFLAQLLWFVIDGYFNRTVEVMDNENNFRKYLVDMKEFRNPLIFINSKISGKWWLECPVEVNNKKPVISCSKKEYILSREGDLPDRLWNALNRI